MSDAGRSGKFLMTIAAGVGTITVEDKPHKEQKLPAAVYPIGNFSPHTFAFLIAAYDKAKGGEQSFEMIAEPMALVAKDGLCLP